jgi:hypothetical protein
LLDVRSNKKKKKLDVRSNAYLALFRILAKFTLGKEQSLLDELSAIVTYRKHT